MTSDAPGTRDRDDAAHRGSHAAAILHLKLSRRPQLRGRPQGPGAVRRFPGQSLLAERQGEHLGRVSSLGSR
jgi:hypothetical protein